MENEDLFESEDDGGIPRFEFENRRGEKGWATFRHLDDLSRADVKKLRRAAGSSDNDGQASNAFFDEALALLVEAWEVPGRENIPIPRYDRQKTTDTIPATFSAALERHLRPHLKQLTRAEDDEVDEGEPGSPRRPARA